MKCYNPEVGKRVCGEFMWLVEKFVRGFSFLNEPNLIFSAQKFTHFFIKFIPNYSELKYNLTCWYL
jgi:hypothetical protein